MAYGSHFLNFLLNLRHLRSQNRRLCVILLDLLQAET